MLPLLAATVLSCALVVLTPGPGVLMVLHLGASGGRRSSFGFVLGHLAGDLVWAALALVALRWVRLVSPVFFAVLTVAGALYLIYLGGRALASARALQAVAPLGGRRAVLRGAAFGVTNPKSYPVTLAIFTAVLGDRVEVLTPATIPSSSPRPSSAASSRGRCWRGCRVWSSSATRTGGRPRWSAGSSPWPSSGSPPGP
ncbi:LysE family translocator [Nonomuraea antimicrobica]